MALTRPRHRILGTAAVAAGLLTSLFTGALPASAAPAPIKLTSSSCPSNIVQGQKSGCVTELQNLLNARGAGVDADGDFGARTAQAVRNFQSASGIAVDGQVGPQTKSKLYHSAPSTPSSINLYSSSCPSNIMRGNKGGCVAELQRLLRRFGYDIDADGDFGPATESAVRSFQSSQGLDVDGQVGPNTKHALYDNDQTGSDAMDLRSSSCPSNIVEGATGGCVRTLQALLNAKGQHIDVDGEFGPNTRAAVIAFQRGAGIDVDGEVGPQTKAALYSGVNPGGGGAPAPVDLRSGSCPSNIVRGAKSGCVTELQSLLNHHGADLVVDGDFGGHTEDAVRDFQSEHGLGVDGQVGPQTKAALYGAVNPPQQTPPPGGGAANILSVAEGELGTVEGSSRANSYGSAVGVSGSTRGYAWCATFVSWVAKQTGATSYRSTWVKGWVNAARDHRNNMSVTSDPHPGDIVAFDWNGGSNFNDGHEHIGIVRTVNGDSFTTVEGNTGKPGGGPDGVWSKNRGKHQGYDVVFIRVAG